VEEKSLKKKGGGGWDETFWNEKIHAEKTRIRRGKGDLEGEIMGNGKKGGGERGVRYLLAGRVCLSVWEGGRFYPTALGRAA